MSLPHLGTEVALTGGALNPTNGATNPFCESMREPNRRKARSVLI